MLCLFETPAGFALFKVLDQDRLRDHESLWQHFETPEKAASLIQLKAFNKFDNTKDAVAAVANLVDSKLPKQLKKFLKKNCDDKLAVVDPKLGKVIAEKLDLQVTSGTEVLELTRGIRSQLEGLVAGLESQNMTQMSLGLSHSLSRYKLKFSPDKVDTMVVQAIGLLDDLDKELNTYAMRVREWYGWHFPELSKIIDSNIAYAKAVRFMGARDKAASLDFSAILDEEVESTLKEAAVVSMGTEISEEDLAHVSCLCDQVVELSEYRAQLYEYLKNRMQAIAPNLTVLVGELVGARLIAHAGTLINLAKAPASTVQILGAEKALFRALKTKHATPKYGLIFHASLIGQASPKNKGKVARVLAAKCALAVRVDALGEGGDAQVGMDSRGKVEARLRQMEGRDLAAETIVRNAGGPAKYDKARAGGALLASTATAYATDADVKMAESEEDAMATVTVASTSAAAAENGAAEAPKKGKKKKRSAEDADGEAPPAKATAVEENGEVKKKKKKKSKSSEDGMSAATSSEVQQEDGSTGEKKKKKKKKSVET